MNYLLVAEVGRILHLSANQVRKLILAGRLRAVDAGTGGRHHWRIPADALEEFSRGGQDSTSGVTLDRDSTKPR